MQHIKDRCQVKNEDVVGATPTGDAPTTSEWATILLPTKVKLILEVWWYWLVKYLCALPIIMNYFEIVNPLFTFSGNIEIYLYFLIPGLAKVVEILSHGSQGSLYPTYSVTCLMMFKQHKAETDISSHDIDLLSFIYSGLNTRWVKIGLIYVWVKSRNCSCLVTWFCYQLIAKPGNKTTAVRWPDPYVFTHTGSLFLNLIVSL